MQKWEYRVLTLIGTEYTREHTEFFSVGGNPAYYRWIYEEGLLGELGEQGWELVATCEEEINGTPKLIFKRPIAI